MNAHTGETALIREEMETKTRITNKLTRENIVKKSTALAALRKKLRDDGVDGIDFDAALEKEKERWKQMLAEGAWARLRCAAAAAAGAHPAAGSAARARFADPLLASPGSPSPSFACAMPCVLTRASPSISLSLSRALPHSLLLSLTLLFTLHCSLSSPSLSLSLSLSRTLSVDPVAIG